MTSVLPSSHGSIPLTQNTAPVHEHRCLYTHDLRRKAKRWQDGFLRFHTFNNRVMIYDVPRNFIGDTHYQDAGSAGLEDGDELTLERTGILIQVGERLETQQTDISGILAKRMPKPINEETSKVGSTNKTARDLNLLQPRSTNIMPRTPARYTGWTGRAQIPQKSPYDEQRTAEVVQNHEEQSRPAKRPRRNDDEHVPLWEVLKTSRPPRPKEAPAQNIRTPMWVRTSDSRANGKQFRSTTSAKKGDSDGQRRLKVKEVIDITSSADDVSETRADPRNQPGRGGVYNSSSPTKESPDKNKNVDTDGRMMPPERVKPFVGQAALSRPATTRDNGPVTTHHLPAPSRSVSRRDTRPAPYEHRTNPLHVPEQSLASIREPPPLPQPMTLEPAMRKPDIPPPKARPPAPPHIPNVNHAASRSCTSSPPVSTTNHLPSNSAHNDAEVRREKQARNTTEQIPLTESPRKPLRLAAAAPRKMLLCAALECPKIVDTIRTRKSSPPSAVLPNVKNLGDRVATASTVAPQKDLDAIRGEQQSEAYDSIGPTPDFDLPETPFSISHIPPTSEKEKPPCRVALGKNKTTKNPSNLRAEQIHQNIPAITRELEAQHHYKNTPPDYSHLDAQLLRDPKPKSVLTTTKFATIPAPSITRLQLPLPAPTTAANPNVPITTTTTTTTAPILPAPNPLPEQPQQPTKPTFPTLHRPFRRHTSDTTLLSPTKNPTAAAAGPIAQKKAKGPLKRAETISGNGVAERRQDVGAGRDREVEREFEVDAGGTGAWSREAWDLFGWVPVGKVVGW